MNSCYFDDISTHASSSAFELSARISSLPSSRLPSAAELRRYPPEEPSRGNEASEAANGSRKQNRGLREIAPGGESCGDGPTYWEWEAVCYVLAAIWIPLVPRCLWQGQGSLCRDQPFLSTLQNECLDMMVLPILKTSYRCPLSHTKMHVSNLRVAKF